MIMPIFVKISICWHSAQCTFEPVAWRLLVRTEGVYQTQFKSFRSEVGVISWSLWETIQGACSLLLVFLPLRVLLLPPNFHFNHPLFGCVTCFLFSQSDMWTECLHPMKSKTLFSWKCSISLSRPLQYIYIFLFMLL